MNDTRLANLRALLKEWDGPTNLSKRLGYRSPAFLVQIAGPNPSRTLSEKTARKNGLQQEFVKRVAALVR